MNKKNTATVAAGLLALGLLVWAAWPEAQAVETARLVRGDFVRELVEDARTRVRERYTVTSPLAGHLVRPVIQTGDTIVAGQVLAEIWPAPAALLDARSQGEQRERVGAMQATVARAQANQVRLQAAAQQAEADLQRTQSLATQGFISSTQLESAELAWQQRQQEWIMAAQELRNAEHELQRLRIGLAQPTISKTGPLWRVRAPVAGRVLKLHRDSEGPIALGAPILELGDTDQLEVVADLLTEDAAGLPRQAQARLAHWGGEGVLRARLSRIEPGAFTKISALGVEEQRVRAVFDWQDSPRSALGDGYKMEIRIVVQQAQGVLMAPVSAVFPQGQGHAVFSINAGRAQLHVVAMLGRNGQQAWLQTDLPEDAVLVTYPPATLREGDRVKPLQP